MTLVQFECAVASEQSALEALDCLDSRFQDILSSTTAFEKHDKSWCVQGIFGETIKLDAAAEHKVAISNALAIDKSDLVLLTLPETDWVSTTLEQLKPIHAGRFVVHGSHRADQLPLHLISVQIDAGLAFGTGHHETTFGCLEMVTKVSKAYQITNALDLGCGSGVLAIALAKLTKRSVLASDIDPIAVEVTRQNAAINGVSRDVASVLARGVRSPLIQSRAPFDLVIANILAKPLRDLALEVTHITKPAAKLILSGLLNEQSSAVEQKYRTVGFKLTSRLVLGEWTTLLMQRG